MPKSISWKSMFIPARRSWSVPIKANSRRGRTSVGATTAFAGVTGTRQRLVDRGVVTWRAENISPGLIGKRRSGPEEADTVVPKSRIGASEHCHCLRLVDRAEQRPAHGGIVERR